MGAAGDDVLGAKAADDVPRLVKLGVGSETRTGAGIDIQEAFARQLCGAGKRRYPASCHGILDGGPSTRKLRCRAEVSCVG